MNEIKKQINVRTSNSKMCENEDEKQANMSMNSSRNDFNDHVIEKPIYP